LEASTPSWFSESHASAQALSASSLRPSSQVRDKLMRSDFTSPVSFALEAHPLAACGFHEIEKLHDP
jgi:hypothetical protein